MIANKLPKSVIFNITDDSWACESNVGGEVWQVKGHTLKLFQGRAYAYSILDGLHKGC
jgi:hypothetical protein